MKIRKEKTEDYNSIYIVIKAAFDSAEHADGNEQDLVAALIKGIGTALIEEGHKIAKLLGYAYVVVLGSEKYYPRTGYVPADTLGIRPPFEVPGENFMAIKLDENSPEINGTMIYAKEFGIES